MRKIDVPEELLCPITHELFKEPVMAEDGHTYEKAAIEQWIKEKGTSPMTRTPLTTRLITNWDKKKQLTNFFEKNKLGTAVQFFATIRSGDFMAIQQLSYLDSYLKTQDSLGFTPLHFAASKGQIELLRLLLEADVNIEAKFASIDTPLYMAVYNNQIEAVKLLLEANANTEAKADSGYTALHKTAYLGLVEVAKLLLKFNANIEAKTNSGNTPLHLAAINDEVEIIKLLLNANATIEAKADSGFTPLHLAAWRGQVAAAKLLLEANANIEAKTNLDNTPLHIVATFNSFVIPINKRIAMTKLLLEQGADYNALNNQNQTPAQAAIAVGLPTIAKLIEDFQQQANPSLYKALQRITALEQLVQEQQAIIKRHEEQLMQLLAQFAIKPTLPLPLNNTSPTFSFGSSSFNNPPSINTSTPLSFFPSASPASSLFTPPASFSFGR